MTITEDIKYVGENDHDIDLFEGQHQVENGMPLMHIFQKNGLQI